MAKIQKIHLIFQNEDYAEIDGKNIEDLMIDGVMTSICTVKNEEEENELQAVEVCSLFMLNVKKAADRDWINFEHVESEHGGQVSGTLFERLAYGDITGVVLFLDEDEVVGEEEEEFEESEDIEELEEEPDEILMPWGEDPDYNDYQNTFREDNGNLRIVITPN